MNDMSAAETALAERAENLKILVVDDHPLIRAGMGRLLGRLADDVEVAGAGDVAGALDVLANGSAFDLILVDLMMPGMNGYEGLSKLRNAAGGAPLVVVSMKERSEDVRQSIEAGAVGYIPKSSEPEILVNALKLVLSGGVYLPPNVLGAVEPKARQPEVANAAAGPSDDQFARLTPRQREVLSLMAQGKSNKEIAKELGLAAGTVKIHVSSIFKALKVSNRTRAVIAARERNSI